MTFTDTNEGTTHSYNDGCGDTEHNHPIAMSEFPEKEGWVEKFGELWDRSFDRDGNKNGLEYGELLLFISIQLARAKEDGYDEGAHESSMVCNEKTIPMAMEEGRMKGRLEILEEWNHEHKKLLDGFAHPKDCKQCTP